MTEINTKYFTPQEARKTLPLVKVIVKDILDNSYQIRTIAESLGGKIEGNSEIEKLAGEVEGFLKELEEIGCYFKDWNFSIGLVDFPALIDGEEVMLCWRSDEDDIYFYHNLIDGYAGRKAIPPALFE